MKRKKREIETCCMADQFCLAPANLDPPVAARGQCFSCGWAVCSKCSSRRQYPDGRLHRICNDCQVELDDSDKRVMARLYRMAGSHGRLSEYSS